MPNATTNAFNTGDEASIKKPRPRVVLCGDPSATDTQAAWNELLSVVPSVDCTQVSGLRELNDRLSGEAVPDLLVFVRTWSDEYRFADVLSISGIGPLSRLLFCDGPWCVSDGRSRPDFPLAIRVPMEHLRPALHRELTQLTTAISPNIPLPWTAGRDEIFQYRWPDLSASDLVSTVPAGRTIRLHSADRELIALWRNLLTRGGYLVVNDADQATEFVLWDIDVWDLALTSNWPALLAAGTQIIAITGFNEPEAEAQIRDAGAQKVLSKLLALQDLLTEIAGLVD